MNLNRMKSVQMMFNRALPQGENLNIGRTLILSELLKRQKTIDQNKITIMDFVRVSHRPHFS